MKNLTVENILHTTKGECRGLDGTPDFFKTEIENITTDSRAVTPGALFAAIPGERTDGHLYIASALEKGAVCVLAERIPEDFPAEEAQKVILVPSTLRALMELAEFYLKQLNIPVIGIVGSVGKTSTKEMTASVLSTKYQVLKTEGNFNNELGLPLTVFRLRERDEIAVLEMGISDFGEMRRLAKIARPDLILMTNIGTCHLDHLIDRNGVWRAKSEVFAYAKEGAKALLSGEDDILSGIHEVGGIHPLHFGLSRVDAFGQANDYYADEIEDHGFEGSSFRIHLPEVPEGFPAELKIPGRHMVQNAVAAAAAGALLGLSVDEIQRGLQEARNISGRFRMLNTNGRTFIDDSYNANPMSMKAALALLEKANGNGRKIAVLGDMGELGEESEKLHAGVGDFAASLAIDAVYCTGEKSKGIIDQMKKAESRQDICWFADRAEMVDYLKSSLKEGDVVLFKASHFMHFDQILAEVLAAYGT